MPTSQPQAEASPQIYLEFMFAGQTGIDYGYLFHSFEFRAMVNGGYIIKATLFDAHFNLLSTLMTGGYLEDRTRVLAVRFQIKAGPEISDSDIPTKATRMQLAYVIAMRASGGGPDKALVEFVAIDPPSWFLNAGDGAGNVYKGKVSQVIQQVVAKYAPNVTLDISTTTDSSQGQWWPMRQDPKTFIHSLLEWSSSITQTKTHWLVGMDGMPGDGGNPRLVIKEQGQIRSRQRAFYRYWDGSGSDTIKSWGIHADNALSILQTKIITQGASAISGHYLDRISDQKEEKLFVKDSTTENKQVAKTSDVQSFTGPPDAGPPQVGWTSISSIPEIYSAGDLGLRYDDYIDGRGRGLWLQMTNRLLRAKFTCLGHGEWSDSTGLGVDTVFIKWFAAPSADSQRLWFATGSWIVYGFWHKVTRKYWYTDVLCARFDYDSDAKQVGGPDPDSD